MLTIRAAFVKRFSNISGDFLSGIGKFFKTKHIKSEKYMKSSFESMYGPYNLMFEDYFMQLLTATAS